jgi:hypothetical protein
MVPIAGPPRRRIAQVAPPFATTWSRSRDSVSWIVSDAWASLS